MSRPRLEVLRRPHEREHSRAEQQHTQPGARNEEEGSYVGEDLRRAGEAEEEARRLGPCRSQGSLATQAEEEVRSAARLRRSAPAWRAVSRELPRNSQVSSGAIVCHCPR